MERIFPRQWRKYSQDNSRNSSKIVLLIPLSVNMLIVLVVHDFRSNFSLLKNWRSLYLKILITSQLESVFFLVVVLVLLHKHQYILWKLQKLGLLCQLLVHTEYGYLSFHMKLWVLVYSLDITIGDYARDHICDQRRRPIRSIQRDAAFFGWYHSICRSWSCYIFHTQG